jgi:uncharacterized protein YbjT (DUF2867 family)
MKILLLLLLVVVVVVVVVPFRASGFVQPSSSCSYPQRSPCTPPTRSATSFLSATPRKQQSRILSGSSSNNSGEGVATSVSRRDFGRAVALSFLAGAGASTGAAAAAPTGSLTPSQTTVAVVGANGQTGRLCVEYLLETGRCKGVVGISRSGALEYESAAKAVRGDVSDASSLPPALKGCNAVIFAAQANFKKPGWNAFDVDAKGVVNVAQACIALGIPRLVVISASTTSRPDSLGYKGTNLIGNIMDAKAQGEAGLLWAYASAPAGLSYTIIRPGGLDGKVTRGPGQLELNQGDTVSGTVSRADLAATSVEALYHSSADNATFELHEAATRYPIMRRFPKISGYERRGDTWDELFQGLVADKDVQRVP